MAQGAENIIVNDDLLSKYFSGEASPEEAIAIDEWKLSNEINQQEFSSLWSVWNHASLRTHKVGDIQSAWQELQPLPKRLPSRRITLLRWAAAASVLFTVVISAALLFKINNKTPQQKTVTASLHKTTQQVLACGSRVTIFPGSSLTYPLSSEGDERHVILNGSGYFDVKTLANKPFIVTAGPVRIKVLGTAFHVSETDTAITIKVVSGKILTSAAGQQLIISGGETGKYLKNEKQLVQVQEQYTFHFDNENLAVVIAALSRAYHKKIIIRDPEIATLKISSNFENKSLDYILEVIAITLNVKYTPNPNNDEIYFDNAN
ncbi:FecR family protein [Chitinophaga filiformis]|uniref:Ferric-dicitrate binding protein FerR, regulates iron transport through sigma-19 n=1 Tax=Chitinophaga filiformis TaxID=104663 RepID=A0A1G7IAD4_CHIFI|nr:FecR domain-containing protein [Chitinophaga filiformis]SDF09642.1 ferric-dicitrate binding protein FerR, regulates iron transport through sigma-19 [Chitinophaga filiformis]